jgi:uncharacterized protein DUF4255
VSTAYGVAAVTAVLRQRLRSRLATAGVGAVTGSIEVSALAPDRVPTDADEPSQLNLFLHHVSLNPGWRNTGLPTRDAAGARQAAPPLALDLHYLLTAYGGDPFHAEILLGHAMQEFHETPVLTAEHIRATLSPPVPDPTLPAPVAASGLADQAEALKITPVCLPHEEVAALWNGIEAHYRPTAAYEVSVVLVDSTSTPRPGLPVVERGIRVEQLGRPVVASVENAAGAGEPILAASTIAIRGERLAADHVTVRFGGAEVAVPPGDVADALVTLPLASLPESPRAGLAGVQVAHALDFGDPPVPHDVEVSNVVPALLRPVVAALAVDVVDTETVDGVERSAGTITVTVDPPVAAAQRVELLLNERGSPAPRAYALAAPAGNGVPAGADTVAAVAIPFAGVAAGTYVVRVAVDGADSPLATGADGTFESPQVTLP